MIAMPVVLVALAHCGGKEAAEPAQVTLSVDPTAVEIEAGDSTTVTATIDRDGFVGAVALAAADSDGVRLEGATMAADADQIVLNVASTFEATVGPHALAISATADDPEIEIEPVTVTVTVTAGPVEDVAPLGAPVSAEASDDAFGETVALSADGRRMAIGAPANGGAGVDAGQMRVYALVDGEWSQIGPDLDGEAAGDRAGVSVAISGDGERVAFGATHNDGASPNHGHVRVFEWSGNDWVQLGADLDPPIGSAAGTSLAMSADGSQLILGAHGHNSSTGYAFVYELAGDAWTQRGSTIQVDGSSELGQSVSMSDGGERVAVGVPGAQGNSRPGTTLVFEHDGNDWVPLGSPILGEAISDTAGTSVALSGDGTRLAIGGPQNTDGGVGGGGTSAGHVRVYQLEADWTQLGGDIDGIVDGSGDNFGRVVDLSTAGDRLIASSQHSGGRIYLLEGGEWVQLGADLEDGSHAWGVSMAGDGLTCAVGYTYSDVVVSYQMRP